MSAISTCRSDRAERPDCLPTGSRLDARVSAVRTASWNWAGILDDLRAIEESVLPLIVHGYVEWRRSAGRRLYDRATDWALDPVGRDADLDGTTGANSLYWSARVRPHEAAGDAGRVRRDWADRSAAWLQYGLVNFGTDLLGQGLVLLGSPRPSAMMVDTRFVCSVFPQPQFAFDSPGLQVAG